MEFITKIVNEIISKVNKDEISDNVQSDNDTAKVENLEHGSVNNHKNFPLLDATAGEESDCNDNEYQVDESDKESLELISDKSDNESDKESLELFSDKSDNESDKESLELISDKSDNESDKESLELFSDKSDNESDKESLSNKADDENGTRVETSEVSEVETVASIDDLLDSQGSEESESEPENLEAPAHSPEEINFQRFKSQFKLKTSWERIFEKYSQDFEGVDDEIDLENELVVVD
jgi:hypothetical protein